MTYDAFDRLKTEYIYDGTAMTYNTYTYDKNSNRTGLLKEVRGPSNPDHYNEETVYTVNAMNQLLSVETTRYEVSSEDGSVNLADPTTETATFTYNDRG